ncbi:MAG TPA: alpha/beta fold hydrolase [Caulobacteraceae bacterium]
MSDPLPILLIPGLLCSPRLFAEQIPALWAYGPVTLADPTRDASMADIARRLLAQAPPRFALVGLSMGGYIAFEVLRQAPGRVARLALLDTAARPDTPEQSERRRSQIGMAREGRLAEVADLQFPMMVSPRRLGDAALKAVVRQMADEVGGAAFVRQQTAIMGRPDSRGGLADIGCPTLVLVGEQDLTTPPDRAREMADSIAHARLVVVPDSGHLSTLEQPAAVNAALAQWLEA